MIYQLREMIDNISIKTMLIIFIVGNGGIALTNLLCDWFEYKMRHDHHDDV